MQTYSHTLTAEEIRDLVGTAPLIVEIGCHDGSDTAKFLEAMPGATLHCFEPDLRPYARFWENVKQSKQVTLYQSALTDSDEPQLFYPSTGRVNDCPDWDYSGSLQRPTEHLKHSPEVKFRDPIQVRCYRLDTWLREEGMRVIDFIWADVQGGQRGLIGGGQCALALTRYLYIECHYRSLYEGEPSQGQLIELLPGFVPLANYGRDNVLFHNRHFQ
jgi:FkbM family methyltransferase